MSKVNLPVYLLIQWDFERTRINDHWTNPKALNKLGNLFSEEVFYVKDFRRISYKMVF